MELRASESVRIESGTGFASAREGRQWRRLGCQGQLDCAKGTIQGQGAPSCSRYLSTMTAEASKDTSVKRSSAYLGQDATHDFRHRRARTGRLLHAARAWRAAHDSDVHTGTTHNIHGVIWYERVPYRFRTRGPTIVVVTVKCGSAPSCVLGVLLQDAQCLLPAHAPGTRTLGNNPPHWSLYF